MENNKQQTAVEWFIEQLNSKYGGNDFVITHINEIEKAKEMEKEQIAKAFDDGDYNYHYSRKTGNDFEDGKEYYQEVYEKGEQ
jgi:disulfide oxidoreductase YuzD